MAANSDGEPPPKGEIACVSFNGPDASSTVFACEDEGSIVGSVVPDVVPELLVAWRPYTPIAKESSSRSKGRDTPDLGGQVDSGIIGGQVAGPQDGSTGKGISPCSSESTGVGGDSAALLRGEVHLELKAYSALLKQRLDLWSHRQEEAIHRLDMLRERLDGALQRMSMPPMVDTSHAETGMQGEVSPIVAPCSVANALPTNGTAHGICLGSDLGHFLPPAAAGADAAFIAEVQDAGLAPVADSPCSESSVHLAATPSVAPALASTDVGVIARVQDTSPETAECRCSGHSAHLAALRADRMSAPAEAGTNAGIIAEMQDAGRAQRTQGRCATSVCSSFIDLGHRSQGSISSMAAQASLEPTASARESLSSMNGVASMPLAQKPRRSNHQAPGVVMEEEEEEDEEGDNLSSLPGDEAAEVLPARPSVPLPVPVAPSGQQHRRMSGAAYAADWLGGVFKMAAGSKKSSKEPPPKNPKPVRFQAEKLHEDALFSTTREAAGSPNTKKRIVPYSVITGSKGVHNVAPRQSTAAGTHHGRKSMLPPYDITMERHGGKDMPEKASFGPRLQEFLNFASEASETSNWRVANCIFVVRTFLSSLQFEAFCGFIILCNSAVIGAETELMTYDGDYTEFFSNIQAVFNAWYVAELLLRAWADNWRFFTSKDWGWNMFDLVLVFTAFLELVFAIVGSGGWIVVGRLLRSFRICRVARTLRLLRMLQYIREFRKMVFAIMASVQTLMWSLLLLGGMMYVFAVLFTQGAVNWLRAKEQIEGFDEEQIDKVRMGFGSLSRSVYSLYMAVSNGKSWGLVCDPLMQMDGAFVAAFIFFISIAIFGVLNIVTSIFVESAMQSATHHREMLIQEKMCDKERYVRHMKEVFRQIDKDGDGEVCVDEIQDFITDEDESQAYGIRTYLEALEIDIVETNTLFKLLDRDGSGFIDIEEFCEGCLRLKGDAKSFDIHCLLYENQRMLAKWADFMEFVETQLYEIMDGSGGMKARTSTATTDVMTATASGRKRSMRSSTSSKAGMRAADRMSNASLVSDGFFSDG